MTTYRDKDTFFETYVPAALSEQEYTVGLRPEIEIALTYSEGGMSYVSGKQNPRGFVLSVWPVQRSENSITRNLFDEGKRDFLVQATARRSPAKGERVARLLEPHVDRIAEAARVRHWSTISNICAEVRQAAQS